MEERRGWVDVGSSPLAARRGGVGGGCTVTERISR